MLRIEYSAEAKFYFLDNDPYTFDLLVKVEELRHTPAGLPADNYKLVAGWLMWQVLDHTVVYRIIGDVIEIRAIKPD